MIQVCKSMDECGRLAQLVEDFRTGRLYRDRAKRGAGVRGCYFARKLPDRRGDGATPWEPVLNGATYEGMNSALDVAFRAQTQITAWFVSLINGSGYSAVSVNDTAASHAGWTELTTYTESVRQTWSPGAASAGVITNASAMTFTAPGSTVSVQGFALFSLSTKGSTSGKLWATAPKAAADSLTAGQPYQVYYEIDLSPLS